MATVARHRLAVIATEKRFKEVIKAMEKLLEKAVFESGDENVLHQKHVNHSAAKDGDEHLALPEVKQAGHENAEEFGQAERATEEVDVFQAVDDQHAEDSGRKNLAEVSDIARCLLAAEDSEGQEARQGCAGNEDNDGEDLLRECHRILISNLLLSLVKPRICCMSFIES